MRFQLTLGILMLLIVAACTAPPEDATRANIVANTALDTQVEDTPNQEYEVVSINKDESTFEFEGYGPGKSHLGTFEEWEGSLYVQEGMIVGGEGVIEAASVSTGIDGLDNHLKSNDFFGVETNPQIKIQSTGLDNGMLSANLDFLGVEKEISFPVEVSENSLSADFVLDTTPFGMDYTGVNNEVRIAFEMHK